MLSIHNLAFLDYGPFNFSVDAGSAISIQGNSGSGKSLLLRAIADLDQHSGEIHLNGREQASIPAPHWRRLIGYMLTDNVFWADIVDEHFEDLQTPFLQHVIAELQLGYLMKQPVAKLSSGEKQRLSLLRLLSNRPEALLLDEPTSHLDQQSRLTVEAIIAEYRQEHQCPLLLVSHDQEQCARLTSRHFVMQNKSLHAAAV